mmetsp:Transcript_73017/g.144749  ORF Transcript_73017/g.144749 Transcript_73017/m.144749 type:complete len:195 (-) Transcript_73017:842-1426(-)
MLPQKVGRRCHGATVATPLIQHAVDAKRFQAFATPCNHANGSSSDGSDGSELSKDEQSVHTHTRCNVELSDDERLQQASAPDIRRAIMSIIAATEFFYCSVENQHLSCNVVAPGAMHGQHLLGVFQQRGWDHQWPWSQRYGSHPGDLTRLRTCTSSSPPTWHPHAASSRSLPVLAQEGLPKLCAVLFQAFLPGV